MHDELMAMIDLDKLLQLEAACYEPGLSNPEWGYYDANKEEVSNDQFIHILYRDGFYCTKRQHYAFAAAAMNAVPELCRELKELRAKNAGC